MFGPVRDLAPWTKRGARQDMEVDVEQMREAVERGAVGVAIRDRLAEVWVVFHIEDWLKPGGLLHR